MNVFGFSGKKQPAPSSANEVDGPLDGSIEVDAAPKNALERSYRLIPVADHPLFPGSTAGVNVTFEQYKELKNVETVFASVVKNDDILKESSDILTALQKNQ